MELVREDHSRNKIRVSVVRNQSKKDENCKFLEGDKNNEISEKALEIDCVFSHQDPKLIYNLAKCLERPNDELEDMLKEVIENSEIGSFEQLMTEIADKLDFLNSQDDLPDNIRKFRFEQCIDLPPTLSKIEIDPSFKELNDDYFGPIQNQIISQILAKKDCTLLLYGTYQARVKYFQRSGLSTNMMRGIMKRIFDKKLKNCYITLSSSYIYRDRINDLNQPHNFKRYPIRQIRRRDESEIYIEDLPEAFLPTYKAFLKRCEKVNTNRLIDITTMSLSSRHLCLFHEFKFYYKGTPSQKGKL